VLLLLLMILLPQRNLEMKSKSRSKRQGILLNSTAVARGPQTTTSREMTTTEYTEEGKPAWAWMLDVGCFVWLEKWGLSQGPQIPQKRSHSRAPALD
jgi:hypothetical protein